MAYVTNPSYVVTGESITADIVNRAPTQIQGNTDHLLALYNALSLDAAQTANTSVSTSSAVIIGTPVYWNNSNSRYEPAQAVTGLTDVVGVCSNKTSATIGDVVTSGKAAIDITAALETGAVTAGWYFLSASTTGKLTATIPSDIGIPVLVADGAGNVFVLPHYRISPPQATIVHNAACINTTVAGSPLYWNSANAQFELALAGTNNAVIGICLSKPTTTTANIVVSGKAAVNFNALIDEGGSAVAGYYFLSNSVAGNVTAARSTATQVPLFIADGAGNIFVAPQDRYIPPVLLLSYSGTTTDSFVTVFTKTYATGLIGVGTIKNTGGSNSLSVKETITDAFGVTDSVTSVVTFGSYRTIDATSVIGAARLPYTSYTVDVKSATPGSATTYSLKFSTSQS